MLEPDELLEMQYEEMVAPTLADYDEFWINANEANDYVNEADECDCGESDVYDGWAVCPVHGE